jgi:hypothetical protein
VDEEGDKGEGEIDEDVEDDNIDELQELSEDEQKQLLEETAAVCETVTKVHMYTIMKQKMFAFCSLPADTNHLLVYRYDNSRLLSLTQPQSLSLLGVVSALRLTRSRSSSLVML